MAENNQVVSFAPDDFVHGGLLDDVDVEVVSSVLKVWDYDPNDQGQGSGGLSTIALKMILKDMQSGEEVAQFWSGGDPSQFVVIDEDGEIVDEGVSLRPITSKQGLNDSTNIAFFCKSLVTEGFPIDRLQNFRADSLVGLQMHVGRIPAPKRKGLSPASGDSEGKREQTILVCTKIIKLPWEKSKRTKGKAKGKAKTPAATAQASAQTQGAATDEEVSEFAVTVLSGVLEANDGSTELAKIQSSALKYMAADKSVPAKARAKVARLLKDEDWLAESGFTLEDGVITV